MNLGTFVCCFSSQKGLEGGLLIVLSKRQPHSLTINFNLLILFDSDWLTQSERRSTRNGWWLCGVEGGGLACWFCRRCYDNEEFNDDEPKRCEIRLTVKFKGGLCSGFEGFCLKKVDSVKSESTEWVTASGAERGLRCWLKLPFSVARSDISSVPRNLISFLTQNLSILVMNMDFL